MKIMNGLLLTEWQSAISLLNESKKIIKCRAELDIVIVLWIMMRSRLDVLVFL